ncbi:MAG: hypothetical protein IPL25_15250 [Saprospiraceae bacterium]|nr:hypothetical protein [Candidatus Vicinibacter affinis]
MKNKICIPFILTLFYCASIFSQTWQKLNGPYGLAVSASLITKDKGEIYCFVYGYASGKGLISFYKPREELERYFAGFHKCLHSIC